MNIKAAWRRQRGAETIEVAIALPIVLIVIFSGLEYGWAVIRSVQLDHAARVGARAAALSGATTADAEARADQALRQIGIDSAIVTVTPSDLTSLPAGSIIKVEVEVPYSDVRLVGLGSLMPLPATIKGHASMIREPEE
jgi:Flp pilus assembly protein TadG